MIVEAHLMDSDLDGLLRNKVGQALYDFITAFTNPKKSFISAVNSTNIEFPVIYSDDMYIEQVYDIAKTIEIKLAYDIKKFLEIDINSSPEEVKYAKLVKDLPITILDRGDGNSNLLSKAFENLGVEISVTDSTGKTYSEAMINERIQKMAVKFAKGYTSPKAKLFGEANSAIISERNAIPSQVEVEVKYITGKKEVNTIKYTISVQCIPKKVEFNELAERIGLYDNKNFFKKFVQLERGQISFISDWLLDLKNLHNRAKANSQGAKNIFNIVDKLNLLQETGVNIYPFTMLIVSNELVEKVMKDHGIDMRSKAEAHRVMKKFFAMGISIYQPETDLVDIIYDGDVDYTTHQYSDFGKDISKYERELKQLIKFNK